MNQQLFFDDLKKLTNNKAVIDFACSGDFIFDDENILPATTKIPDDVFCSLYTYNIVIVNGFFDTTLSSKNLPVEVMSTKQNNYNKEIINITKSTDKPLHIIFVSFNNEKQKRLILPHIEININDNVSVDIIKSNLDIGDGQYFENKNLHINIGKNTRVNLYNFYDGKFGSCVFDNNYIKTAENSNVNIVSITKAENILSKKTIFDVGKNSNIFFNASICGIKNGNISDDILLNHFENNATSNTNSYAVVFDSSNIHFKTNVICKKDRENINTSQVSKILLDGDNAKGKIDPYQTISTEKVSAFHGATISGISNAELFFLESRGINKQTAKNMIYNSYLQTPLAFIKNEKIYECFVNSCANLLPKS